MSDDANEFLMGGGARAFQFTNMGDTVRGEIVSMTKRQQTSLDDNKPLYWDNGDPRMMLVIILETENRDANDDTDDGFRSIYVRGGNYVAAKGEGSDMRKAIFDAVKKSGAGKIEDGGTLTVQYSGESVAKRGFSAAKLYKASYKAPVSSVDLDELA